MPGNEMEPEVVVSEEEKEARRRRMRSLAEETSEMIRQRKVKLLLAACEQIKSSPAMSFEEAERLLTEVGPVAKGRPPR